MVLGPRGPGRVGRRQRCKNKADPPLAESTSASMVLGPRGPGRARLACGEAEADRTAPCLPTGRQHKGFFCLKNIQYASMMDSR
jgi:hypothetical protein